MLNICYITGILELLIKITMAGIHQNEMPNHNPNPFYTYFSQDISNLTNIELQLHSETLIMSSSLSAVIWNLVRSKLSHSALFGITSPPDEMGCMNFSAFPGC